jgi:phage shock protein C
MFCGACSQQMNADARFCCRCGKPIPVQSANFYGGRLTRPRYGRMIGGVCAGFAEHYGWDVALVRVVAVLLLVFGHVLIFIAYIAAWIVMPEEPLYWMPQPPPPTSYAPPPPPPYAGSAPIS